MIITFATQKGGTGMYNQALFESASGLTWATTP